MKDEEILIAKQKAMNKFPYYGPVLARSRVEEDNNIDTMCINNRLCIKYNSKFFLGLNDEDRMAVVTHECMHAVSDHHHRWLVNPWRGKASFTLANIAMDMEINQHLKDDCSGSFLQNAWTPDKMEYPEGKSFEWYLDMIMQDIENDRKQNPQNGNGQGQGNSNQNGESGEDDDNDSNQSNGGGSGSNRPMSNQTKKNIRDMRNHQDQYEQIKEAIKDALSKTTSNLDMTNAEETDTESQQELQDVINECKEAMKGIGSEHRFSDVIRKVPPKRYDWRKVLTSLILSRRDSICRGRDKMTFTRVNRRMAGMNSDVIFSEKYSETKVFNLVVGIDVSGSMGELTTEMYSRLKTINSQTGGNNHITVVECDCDICNVMMDFEPCVNEIKSSAGGGTDMEAIPRWVANMVEQKKMKEPDLIIIMTDNFVSWSEKGHPKFGKKTVVLTNNPDAAECPYKMYEVIIDN